MNKDQIQKMIREEFHTMLARKHRIKKMNEADPPREDSQAGEEAKKRGLQHMGWGRYADKTGNVVAKSVNGKLVDYNPNQSATTQTQHTPGKGTLQKTTVHDPGEYGKDVSARGNAAAKRLTAKDPNWHSAAWYDLQKNKQQDPEHPPERGEDEWIPSDAYEDPGEEEPHFGDEVPSGHDPFLQPHNPEDHEDYQDYPEDDYPEDDPIGMSDFQDRQDKETGHYQEPNIIQPDPSKVTPDDEFGGLTPNKWNSEPPPSQGHDLKNVPGFAGYAGNPRGGVQYFKFDGRRIGTRDAVKNVIKYLGPEFARNGKVSRLGTKGDLKNFVIKFDEPVEDRHFTGEAKDLKFPKKYSDNPRTPIKVPKDPYEPKPSATKMKEFIKPTGGLWTTDGKNKEENLKELVKQELFGILKELGNGGRNDAKGLKQTIAGQHQRAADQAKQQNPDAKDSEASKEAERRGLTHQGWGRYADKTGNVVAKSVNGKLVDIDPTKGVSTTVQHEPNKFTQVNKTIPAASTGDYTKNLAARTATPQAPVGKPGFMDPNSPHYDPVDARKERDRQLRRSMPDTRKAWGYKDEPASKPTNDKDYYANLSPEERKRALGVIANTRDPEQRKRLLQIAKDKGLIRSPEAQPAAEPAKPITPQPAQNVAAEDPGYAKWAETNHPATWKTTERLIQKHGGLEGAKKFADKVRAKIHSSKDWKRVRYPKAHGNIGSSRGRKLDKIDSQLSMVQTHIGNLENRIRTGKNKEPMETPRQPWQK